MKNVIYTLSKTLFFILFMSTFSNAQTTPLAANGRLKVTNRQLCNEAGTPIQLRGMSTHGLQWFGSCYTAGATQALANSWGCDVFRAAMYVDEGGYLSNKAGIKAQVDNITDWSAQYGMYCIIDWHTLNPGDPNLHTADAIDFFRQEAQRNAGKKHVIYEICNEPNGVAWSSIKSYAEQVIPVIRQYDPEAIILVGTPNWSGTPGDVTSNPLTGANAYNVMYTFHFYAGSHYTQSYIDGVLQNIPLFISEWGTSNYSGNGGNDYTNAQNWINLLAGANTAGIKVSWCNWSFCDKSETSAALNAGACGNSGWNNTSESGTWVKNHILSPADNWGSAPPTLVGYWHNWSDANAPYIPLDQVDARYNIVNVSFGIPQSGTTSTIVFTPDQSTQAAFISQIQTLHSQGRKVVLSLGGATAPISINNATQLTAFVNSVTNILNTYSFDGIDIDFEGSSLSITGGTIASPIDQPIINLIAGIKQIMSNFRTARGSKMYLSMAPETAFAQGGMSAYSGIWGAYLPVIHALRDSMDILHVQLYNSGSMYGINGSIYTQGTADFIVSQTEAMIKGFNTNGGAFVGLPANKIAVGLPACTGAAGSGYVAPATVKAAIDYLRGTGAKPGTYTLAQAGGYPDLRGMMTWSINWDKVCSPTYQYAQNFQTIFSGTITNQPPSVSITSPTNNASFNAPATITIAANATDADGTITKVDFYNGTTLLGTDNTAPYTFSWANVAVGNYALTAKATDNSGAVTTSSTVNIVVKTATNQAPSVSITSPTNNATFNAPATITIAANATDADGTITKVDFYNGTTLLGSDNTAPYTFSWANVAVGNYALTAKATDNSGAVTTSATVNIVVKTATNQAPSVSITSPANNASFNAPATITIAANATDADGTITKVDFYRGTTLLGTDNTAPYTFSWANVAVGNYALTAKATDNSGAVTTSATVNIVVKTATNQAPSVSITSPANNATFNAPATITIAANATDADGTISKVDFYRGTTLLGTDNTAPYAFSWANVAVGNYSLTAKATDNSGAVTTSATVNIVVNSTTTTADIIGPDCVAVNGIATFELSAANRANATAYSWWCNGSTSSITPVVGQPWKATINFGPWFTGGSVCVGVNYSVSPWYKQICKTVSLCPPARLSAVTAKSSPVSPIPTSNIFNFVANQNVQGAKVFDHLGIEKLNMEAIPSGQSRSFGELLPTGIYFLNIRYEDETSEVIKLIKVN